MIIKEVYLRDFISYTEARVKFPLGVTVIVGENGSGKTSILDAITYALFMEHSRGPRQNLIKRGATSARVGAVFSVKGRNYQVEWDLLYQKSPRGHLRDLDNDRPLVKPGSGEMTIVPEISRLTGLDSTVFMNAIYVKQGEIARLLDDKPHERKKTIAHLLGIEELEKLWDAMKGPLNELEERLEYYARQLDRMKDVEAQLKEKELQLSDRQSEYGEKEHERVRLEEEVRTLQRMLKEMEENRRNLEELDVSILKLEGEIDSRRNVVKSLDEKIQNLEAALRDLSDNRSYHEEAGKIDEELRDLSNRVESIDQTIDKKRRTKSEVERMRSELDMLEKVIAGLVDDFRRVTRVSAHPLELPDLREHLLRDVEVRVEKEERKRRAKELKRARYGGLMYASISGSFLAATILYLAFQNPLPALLPIIIEVPVYLHLRRRRKSIEEEINSIQDGIKGLWEERAKLEALTVSDVRGHLEKYQRLSGEISRLDEDIKDLDQLERDHYNLRERIRQLQEHLDRLQPMSERYVKALGVIEREGLSSHAELEERIERLKRERSDSDEVLKGMRERLDELRTRRSSITYDREKHDSTRKRLEEILREQREIEQMVAKLSATIEHLSEDCKRLRVELDSLREIRDRYQRLERDVTLLRRIRELFHKDGLLQKSVRRQAASMIGEAARTFLQDFGLQFSGIEVDEDFNVNVIGRYGKQPLETLSGGERIVVALVLRLAIAVTLAGESLETIIMDEPTVYLDSERRRELSELLKNFRGGGRLIPQVIVVSHDRELEDSADQVYEVVLSESGSVIRNYGEFSP
ncbi:MAG: AAA family ATPase [Aigarchaeota archaeon]|nr:AAA family ATPase [Aigarchaeota archaeon]MDW8092471.1 AAA family ATPase [Nitrososphaerota archaeon]